MPGPYDSLMPNASAGYGYPTGSSLLSDDTLSMFANLGNQRGLFDTLIGTDIDWEKEGLLGGMGDIMGDIGKIANPLMQGFSLYNQWNTTNKYMDMMNEQLGMAKEQWAMTKDEINRIRNTRNNLTKQWNATAAKNAPYVKPQQAPQTLNA